MLYRLPRLLAADLAELVCITEGESDVDTLWEGMRQTLHRFPHAAVILEIHLHRDPPQTVGFLHAIERAGYLLRSINYEGEIVPVEAAAILAQAQEHWTLWLKK